jgi:hypothetical protein
MFTLPVIDHKMNGIILARSEMSECYRPFAIQLEVIKFYVMCDGTGAVPGVHGVICRMLSNEIEHALVFGNVNSRFIKVTHKHSSKYVCVSYG